LEVEIVENLHMAQFKEETTHQLTTFRLPDKSKVIPVRRGEKVTIGEVSGKGYISQLWLTFPGYFYQHWDPEQPISQTILKTLILRIYWDNATEPAVAAPVGDFFGIGLCEPGNFASQYLGMSSGGFFCKFPMPFRKGFRIEIENLDDKIDTIVFMNVLYQLTEDINESTGYFHTQFHTARLNGEDPVHIAEVAGRGHYAGCTLSMQGKPMKYFAFLEAPEYVYVDDDWETPRIVGTGLEDYFLGGWYFREGVFTGPYHGVPVKDPLNSSIVMYRIHDADAIHFKKRFKFAFINPRDASQLKPFCYSSVAFLYLDSPEGRKDQIPAKEKLLCWYRMRVIDHLSIP
jgi:hypothetical protein